MAFINSKNITPRKLAFINATFLSIIVLLVALLIIEDRWETLILFGVTFISSYLFYLSTLQFFIYRKIKLIYKLIFETKATRREEIFYKTILPTKSIDDVKDEVEKWANRKNVEIDVLKTNEQYRKEFLMNLAHELRTPIFTTQGYIHTLLNGAINDDAVNLNFLNNAAKSIDRLADLTSDIEQITNLESGKIPLVLDTFIIQDLIKEVYAELQLFAQEKNAELTIKKGTESKIGVLADKNKIRQVLINLLTNAIKYGGEDNVINCGSYLMDERKVLVEVSDSGPGIAEEHLGRVFERFYRADKSRDRKIAGTGLGLSIVKHIVEAHGQTVTVRSKENIGTTFGFTLEKS